MRNIVVCLIMALLGACSSTARETETANSVDPEATAQPTPSEPQTADPAACGEDEDCLGLVTECNGGDMEGCFNLGRYFFDGLNVERDRERAARLYEHACEGGRAESCHALAEALSYGRGLGRDVAQAARFYELACERGDMRGCFGLGYLYEHGTGVPTDLSRAVRLYTQACDGECVEACTMLGHAYASGRGVTQNDGRAFEIYAQICRGSSDMRDSGCFYLGRFYENGRGVPASRVRVLMLYEHACVVGGGPIPGGSQYCGIAETTRSRINARDQQQLRRDQARAQREGFDWLLQRENAQ